MNEGVWKTQSWSIFFFFFFVRVLEVKYLERLKICQCERFEAKPVFMTKQQPLYKWKPPVAPQRVNQPIGRQQLNALGTTWWRRFCEVHTEHRNGSEGGFTGLWMWLLVPDLRGEKMKVVGRCVEVNASLKSGVRGECAHLARNRYLWKRSAMEFYTLWF